MKIHTKNSHFLTPAITKSKHSTLNIYQQVIIIYLSQKQNQDQNRFASNKKKKLLQIKTSLSRYPTRFQALSLAEKKGN